MGTSVRMIERCYGALLDGAGTSTAGRLDAHDDDQGAAQPRSEGVQATTRPRNGLPALTLMARKPPWCRDSVERERRDSNPRPPA
jgi:hypothetical protein